MSIEMQNVEEHRIITRHENVLLVPMAISTTIRITSHLSNARTEAAIKARPNIHHQIFDIVEISRLLLVINAMTVTREQHHQRHHIILVTHLLLMPNSNLLPTLLSHHKTIDQLTILNPPLNSPTTRILAIEDHTVKKVLWDNAPIENHLVRYAFYLY